MEGTGGRALEERTVSGLHEALEPAVSELPRDTAVLDLGCGSGAWLARMRALGFSRLHGADARPDPGFEWLAYERADLDAARPFAGRRFGLVTAIEVIEHLQNPGRLLESIAALLEDDGVAIVTTPNIHSLRCRLKFLLTGRLASFDDKGDPTHISPMLLPALRKVAERHGLQARRVWTYPEHGTRIFTARLSAAAAMLRPALRDALPGDTLCVLLARGAA